MAVPAGSIIIAGLLTRLAAIPLIIDMFVAIASTKVPILIGQGYLGLAAPAGKTGFWAMLHEARVDFSMLLWRELLAAGRRRRVVPGCAAAARSRARSSTRSRPNVSAPERRSRRSARRARG